SFSSGEIFPIIDKQKDLFTSLVVAQGNQSVQIQPQSSNIYHGCQRGESIFHSMELGQRFDLDEFLDPSKYLAVFNETIRDISVNIENLKLLSDPGRQALLKYQKSDLKDYDYDSMILLLSRPVVKQNLSVFASELDQKAELLVNAGIKSHLQQEAENARLLHKLVVLQRADAVNMSGSVKALQNISQSYEENVDTALGSFSRTQTAMNARVPLITANVSQCTLETAEIVEEVMGCGWLSRSVDNIYTANGFWLSLGWCCAFLVPAVFLSLYVSCHLPPRPAAPPPAPPHSFAGNDYPDVSLDTEKKGEDRDIREDTSKSNIYVTLSEL
ncbi:hypothetical protein CRUP_009222, partial [Coryphaenoides rupestris]